MNNTSLVQNIATLKQQRNAVILAHNYQRDDVQDIADFTGDSLELSRKAAEIKANVIVFCGVHFMAETAAILCPDKTVLLPDEHAGCPMADMITAEQLIQKKNEMPGAIVVAYVNTSAAVKAEADICCTSSNGVSVVESVAGDEILFVPDQYLGHYISTQTDKKMTLWPGYCPTHAKIQPETIIKLKERHPQAKVTAHPECTPLVLALADAVLSTGGMIRYARREDIREMIVVTENGIIHKLKKDNPDKVFIPVSEKTICPNMKLITLEKILWALEDMAPRVTVPEDIRIRAKAAVDRMLAVA
ncbi:quinolinate synthase NadA [Chloroflexota bacterium]